jgi:uncharacterized protein DUF6112
LIRLACVITNYGFDFNQVPANNVIQNLVRGGAAAVAIVCVVGLLLSAAAWAIGSRSGNVAMHDYGKGGVVTVLGAALTLGLAGYLVNWFINAGQVAGTGC